MQAKTIEEISQEYGTLFENKEILELSLAYGPLGPEKNTPEEQYLKNARKNKKDFLSWVEKIIKYQNP